MAHDTKKKQKSLLKKIFHSTTSPVKETDTRVSISSLKKLAKTKEHEDILMLIENETIPSVKDAWIDYFMEKTKPSKYKKGD